MYLPILAVDQNIEVSLREQTEWQKCGITTIRVNTMQEAIGKLNNEDFILTVINADDMHYLPLLRIMRELTKTPIFVITSNFSLIDQVEALHHGADAYTSFQSDTTENVQLAMAYLHRYHEQERQIKKPIRILSHEKLFVFPAFYKTFFYDKEIKLNRKEFDLLCLLMRNRGLVFTYRQIFRNVWGEEYADNSKEILWNQIRQLRNKLQTDPEQPNYIRTVHGIGYSFDPQHDNN